MDPQSFTVVEIGRARSALHHRADAPQQPGGAAHEAGNARGVSATIAIHAPYRECLRDLEGFERVWILYVFHRNTGWRPTVRPPRGDKKRGLFATRGPHRPSPIGMVAARLVAVHPDRVDVDEVDLLDDTPVIDIKPYLPFADAFPSARAGWVSELDEEE